MKSREKKLLQLYRGLESSQQGTLYAFAEFLAQQPAQIEQAIPEPEILPAVDGETVVGAMKRLAKSYPMLDKAKMLDETSTLMTQHVLQGRDKNEVITELEIVFQRHYARLTQRNSDQ